MANVSVLLLKRKKGCIKLCPVCDAKNTALATGCKKCKADLQKVKRSYAGKGFSYRIRWQDRESGRFREETVGSDVVLAKKRQGERLKELLNGEYREVKQISFKGFQEKYLSVCEKTKSEGHHMESERTLRFFYDVCKPANLSKIDFAMLETFRDKRIEDKLSPATVNKEIRNLQAAFGYAVEYGFLKHNPVKAVRKKLMLKEPEPVPVIVEPQQYKMTLEACPDTRWKAMVTIGYFAGLRLGEILALEWKDMDFRVQMLHVRNKLGHKTKSRKNRSIPMFGDIEKALEPLQPDIFKGSFIFSDGKSISLDVKNASRNFKRILKQADMVDEQGDSLFTMHNLRDTFITNLLQTGTDPKTVQTLAGHSSVQTTLKYYAGVRAKGSADAIERLKKFAV